MVYSLERCAGSENDGTPLVSAFSVVERITAPDDRHVEVTLKELSLEFLYSMTAAIIPEGSGGTTGTSMYPANKTYFMPELAEQYPHDVEKTRELLAQAGYPHTQ